MAQARRKNRPTAQNAVPRWFIGLLVILAGVVVWRLMPASPAHGAHPDPRPDASAAAVISPDAFAAAPDIAATYAMAQAIPQILDGLYCHCDCSLHSGHRSLLSCFESDHGAWCDVCLDEARLAHRMHNQGSSLDQIRAAIDATWGG